MRQNGGKRRDLVARDVRGACRQIRSPRQVVPTEARPRPATRAATKRTVYDSQRASVAVSELDTGRIRYWKFGLCRLADVNPVEYLADILPKLRSRTISCRRPEVTLHACHPHRVPLSSIDARACCSRTQ